MLAPVTKSKENYIFDEIIKVLEEKFHKDFEEKMENINQLLIEKTKSFKNRLKIFSFYVVGLILIHFLEMLQNSI